MCHCKGVLRIRKLDDTARKWVEHRSKLAVNQTEIYLKPSNKRGKSANNRV